MIYDVDIGTCTCNVYVRMVHAVIRVRLDVTTKMTSQTITCKNTRADAIASDEILLGAASIVSSVDS